jgi:hypothetical protein
MVNQKKENKTSENMSELQSKVDVFQTLMGFDLENMYLREGGAINQ